MQARQLAAPLFAAVFIASSAAFAQGLGPAPHELAEPVTLTQRDVERLLVVLPEVAKEGAKLTRRLGPEPSPEALRNAKEMRRIEQILAEHGLDTEEFAAQAAALVSTYLALSPEAFEEQLPRESDPEIQEILRDPSVPDAEKEALRQQIRMAHENKEKLRAELTQLATEENKRVVRPMLSRVKAVLDEVKAATGE